MTPPTISVIIPVYNGAAFVGDAIQSVLAQSGYRLEVLVVDDGSTDQTGEVVQRFGDRVRYIRQENQGAAAARNRALGMASGEWISFLDADDVWMPGKLDAHFRCHAAAPNAHILWGNARYALLSGDSVITPGSMAGLVLNEPLRIMALASMLFQRAVLNRVGLFDVGRRHGEDMDLMMRIREAGFMVAKHEDVVLVCRRHDRNLTNDVQAVSGGLVSAVRASLARKRAGLTEPSDSSQ